MKNIITLIFLAFTVGILSGCSNTKYEVLELELPQNYFDLTRDFVGLGNNLYFVYSDLNGYVVEKYNHNFEKVNSYQTGLVSTTGLSVHLSESNEFIYFTYHEPNSELINIVKLSPNLILEEEYHITINDSLTAEIFTSFNLVFSGTSTYLISDLGIIQTTKQDDDSYIEANLVDYNLSVVDFHFDEVFYIVVSKSDNNSISDQSIPTTTNYQLIRLNENYSLDEVYDLTDLEEYDGIVENDKIYVYGQTQFQPLIFEIDREDKYVNRYLIDTETEGYVYGIKSMFFRDNTIKAILEKTSSSFSILSIDMQNKDYEILNTSEFYFSSADHFQNYLGSSADYYYVYSLSSIYIVGKEWFYGTIF